MKKTGFTLIELLVAISVLAIVAVLGWRGLDGIVRARIALTGEMEQVRGMQLAFAQMQSDCEHIVGSTAIADRSLVLVEQDRVVLVRAVFADDQPSRVQVVAYQLRNGELTRRESEATRDLNVLNSLWLTMIGDANVDRAVVLQSGIADMRMRVWINDGNGWRAPAADVARAAATSAAVANGSTGLEITLRLQGHGAGMTKVFLLRAV